MKIIGIVCEYNPFHNGHKYQIDKIKKLYPESLIIVVSSSSFTQRGEASILSKWEKCEIALNNGVDLFIELPYVFSTQGADKFAYGAISILNSIKIDALVFGSEDDNLDRLISVAKVQINNKEFDTIVKEHLDEGLSYPTSVSKAVFDLTKISISKPNELLGVSYIKEVLKLKRKIEILPIRRTNDFHDIKSNDRIVSASNIREKFLLNESLKNYVPLDTYNIIKNKKMDYNKYFELLKYKIFVSDDLTKYVDVDEGIESRIKRHINDSFSLDELISNIKTKRYTYNKISRMLNHILIDFTKEDNKKFEKPSYIRVLGMTNNGKKHLNSIKKKVDLPILTKFENELLSFELKVTKVYSLMTNIDEISKEWENKPIIKE